MVVHKRKKVRKYRGGGTHGGGSRRKRRGAGSRGGRGRAGTGKRAGQKKAGSSFKLGRHGFASHHGTKVKAVNLNYFTTGRVEKLVQEGKATKEGSVYILNLGSLGYGKLLGTGDLTLKLKFIVDQCSASAAEKVKKAGGEVVVPE